VRRNSENPFRAGLLRRRSPTLREWCAYWLGTDAAKRPSPGRRTPAASNSTCSRPLGDRRLDAITRHDVQRLVASVGRRGDAPHGCSVATRCCGPP